MRRTILSVLLSTFVVACAADSDPFADMARLLMSDNARLKADRDAKREAFKRADASLKQAKKLVADLERQLHAAQGALSRNESAFEKAKAEKVAAEKAMMSSLTGFAEKVKQTAEGKLADLKVGLDGAASAAAGASSLGRVDPGTRAEVVLWDARNQKGKSVRLKCCGHFELGSLLKGAGVLTVRSLTVPAGIKVTMQASAMRSTDGIGSSFFDVYGNMNEMDGLVRDYRQSCCSSIDISAGVEYNDHTSVVLYEEENFQGKSAGFLQGDYAEPSLKQVGSIRVPAGFRVTLRATADNSDAFGSILAVMRRDSRTFPLEDTATSNRGRQPNLPVRSLSVRQIDPQDMHGLWVFPEPDFVGRAQFFESSEHYLYPEAWPTIRSLRPTNQTFARLVAAGGAFVGVLKVDKEVADLEANYSQPQTLEVTAICEPSDFCGEHGRCVQPQRCSCSGGYSGERCHLQVPDETSAIICEHNAIAVGEPLSCWLVPRRDNAECNATSLFMKVDLSERALPIADIYGSSIIKGERTYGHVTREADRFAFDVVFNASGNISEPFAFTVFNKPQGETFIPQLEVLGRCDAHDTVAKVDCAGTAARSCGGGSCALTLHQGSTGTALRCPVRSIRLLLEGASVAHAADRKAEEIAVRSGNQAAAAASFCFIIDDAVASAVGRPAHLSVEVRHGIASEVPSLRIQKFVDLATLNLGFDAAVKTPSHESTLAAAGVLLRHGDALGALEKLERCLRNRACLKFQASLLAQLGRFQEAEAALKALGEQPGEIVVARRAAEDGASALARGEADVALANFETAISVASLSVPLRLDRADAALNVGAFDSAIEEARQATRLGSSLGHTSSGGRIFLILGRALLAIGLGDAAIHNFNSCAQAEELLGGDGLQCSALASKAKALSKDASQLDAALRNRWWRTAMEKGERMLQVHDKSIPRFDRSVWGLRVSIALCIARSAKNVSDAASVRQPCAAVVEAPEAMHVRLDAEDILKCHMALIETLERDAKLADALQWAEAAEEMLSTYDVADGDLAAEVRLLRERLWRANSRQHSGSARGRESNNTDNKTKPAPKKPVDHYEILGLARNATLQEIKSAYRRLALKYHPDKNPDPEAVPMFLDIQQAYQILSDPDLRRRYDAGQTVEDDAGNKNMKPMKYKIVEIDRENGIAKVWWYDPNTGEEGFMEVEIDKEEKADRQAVRRALRDHCCLPN